MPKLLVKNLIKGNMHAWPEGVFYDVNNPSVNYFSPFSIENKAVDNALFARRREFLAGRAAARLALSKLGIFNIAIPMGEDRAPIWPDSAIGSISHTKETCIAVVASNYRYRAIGIDVECLCPLEPAVQNLVITPEELDYVKGHFCFAALKIFLMKEAVYKAQYSLSKRFLSFESLKLTSDGLVFQHDVPPFTKGTVLPMMQWCGSGLSLCLIPLESDAREKVMVT